MDSPPPPTNTLPETPPGIIKEAHALSQRSIQDRFQELTAEIFVKDFIDHKTEKELLEMTAKLVIAILMEQSFKMTPEVMNEYHRIKERILSEKRKKIPTASPAHNSTMMIPRKWLT